MSLLIQIGIGLLLCAAALFLLLLNEHRTQVRRLAEERRKALGLPPGKLVYEDADGQGETLISAHYPLAGKPDYVVQLSDGRPVPIELKPSVHDTTGPYSNHVVQLAAYCLILEDYFDQAPTHGIIRYSDAEYTVEYTPAIRRKVLRLLEQMASCTPQRLPQLTKQRAAKCRACAYQQMCPVGRGK